MYRVRLAPSGNSFTLQRTDTLLEGALRAGLAPNYGCSNGNCGLCKARVVSGEVVKARPHDYVLTAAEKTQGVILMCSTAAASDLDLEAGEARAPEQIPRQHIVARLRQLTPLSDRITLLHLQTPRTQRLRFLAGQSVTLSVPGASAECAIASCPCDDRNLQFHVPRSGDDFSRRLHECHPTEAVTVAGPHGTFALTQAPGRPVAFVAGGTGFAPIKSLVEHLMAVDETCPIELVWLAEPGEHYLDNLCRSWADALDAFRYLPLTLADDDYAAALDHVPALAAAARYAWYVAGPSPLLTAARERLSGTVSADALHLAPVSPAV